MLYNIFPISVSNSVTLVNFYLGLICSKVCYFQCSKTIFSLLPSICMLFVCVCVCVCALPHSVMSTYVMLWTVAHQTPLSMGILQARILEWVAISSSRGSSQSRDWTQVSHIAGLCFTVWATSHFWKKTWPSSSNSDFPTNCPFSPSHCFCVKSGLFDSPQLF